MQYIKSRTKWLANRKGENRWILFQSNEWKWLIYLFFLSNPISSEIFLIFGSSIRRFHTILHCIQSTNVSDNLLYIHSYYFWFVKFTCFIQCMQIYSNRDDECAHSHCHTFFSPYRFNSIRNWVQSVHVSLIKKINTSYYYWVWNMVYILSLFF